MGEENREYKRERLIMKEESMGKIQFSPPTANHRIIGTSAERSS